MNRIYKTRIIVEVIAQDEPYEFTNLQNLSTDISASQQTEDAFILFVSTIPSKPIYLGKFEKAED